MALVTTPADPNADSYAEIADVTTFLSYQPGRKRSGWDALPDDTARENLLKHATQMIDESFRFHGEKSDEDQALEFPRKTDTNDGGSTYFIPRGVHFATIEAALAVVEATQQDIPQNVKSFSVGSFSATVDHSLGLAHHPAVLRWLEPYISRIGTVDRSDSETFVWPEVMTP